MVRIDEVPMVRPKDVLCEGFDIGLGFDAHGLAPKNAWHLDGDVAHPRASHRFE